MKKDIPGEYKPKESLGSNFNIRGNTYLRPKKSQGTKWKVIN